MLKFFTLLLLTCALSISVNAATGCVDAARTRIYTSQHPSGYWRTNTYSTSSAGCFYVYTGSICSIGSVGANNGYLGNTSNAQECPIDDYVWIIITLLGGLGYLFVKQMNIRKVDSSGLLG